MRKLEQRQTLMNYLRRYRADIHRVGFELRSMELVEQYANQLRGMIHAAMVFDVITVSQFTMLGSWVSKVEALYYKVTRNAPQEANARGGA